MYSRAQSTELPIGAIVKLLIIEDHPIVVAGCRTLFADHQDITLIEANSLAAARDILSHMQPDVIIADIDLPDGSGIEFTREIVSENAAARVVVFSMSDVPILAIQAIEAGAMGYVSKNGDPVHLREAVFALMLGQRWFSPQLLQQMAFARVSGTCQIAALSDREARVLRELVRGRSMAEIADKLEVSYKTVANDCAALRTKLNARTNPEMVRKAFELRLT